ncbi:hypothetical protein P7C70_g4861, partial [Phenoliferia sp. Uapishka_3]
MRPTLSAQRSQGPRSVASSDNVNWAPANQVPAVQTSTMQQLPDLRSLGPNAPTSNNISAVQREMEYSIDQLLSEKVFEDLMRDLLGRHRFRDYLVTVHGDVPSFDLWVDLRAFKGQTERLKTTSVALHDTIAMSAFTMINDGVLSTELKEDVMSALRQGMLIGDSLEAPQQTLLSSLATHISSHLLLIYSGGQTEVSGILAAGKNLSWLVGSEKASSAPVDITEDFSPSLRAYSAAITVNMGARPDAALGGFHAHATPADTPAGGQAKVGRQNEFGAAGPSERKGLKSLFKDWSGSAKKDKRMAKLSVANDGQMIANAESMFSRTAAPIDLQLAQFTNVYNKVIIFRRKTREVLFVTGEFLRFCDMPHKKPGDIYRSALLQTDFLDSIAAPEIGADYKTLRRALRNAISSAKPLSVAVGIRSQKKRGTQVEVKSGVLHLTPLYDGAKICEAFVAIEREMRVPRRSLPPSFYVFKFRVLLFSSLRLTPAPVIQPNFSHSVPLYPHPFRSPSPPSPLLRDAKGDQKYVASVSFATLELDGATSRMDASSCISFEMVLILTFAGIIRRKQVFYDSTTDRMDHPNTPRS